MNKIKRGVSLLLCSLLFGSAVTLGNVADVQAGKQIKTETKKTFYFRSDSSFDWMRDSALSAYSSDIL